MTISSGSEPGGRGSQFGDGSRRTSDSQPTGKSMLIESATADSGVRISTAYRHPIFPRMTLIPFAGAPDEHALPQRRHRRPRPRGGLASLHADEGPRAPADDPDRARLGRVASRFRRAIAISTASVPGGSTCSATRIRASTAAVREQLDRLEHVMLAGFTHEPVLELSECPRHGCCLRGSRAASTRTMDRRRSRLRSR